MQVLLRMGFNLDTLPRMNEELKKCLLSNLCRYMGNTDFPGDGTLTGHHLRGLLGSKNVEKFFLWGLLSICCRQLEGVIHCEECNGLKSFTDRKGVSQIFQHCGTKVDRIVYANAVAIRLKSTGHHHLVCVDCCKVWTGTDSKANFTSYLGHMIMEILLDPESTSAKMGMTVWGLVRTLEINKQKAHLRQVIEEFKLIRLNHVHSSNPLSEALFLDRYGAGMADHAFFL